MVLVESGALRAHNSKKWLLFGRLPGQRSETSQRQIDHEQVTIIVRANREAAHGLSVKCSSHLPTILFSKCDIGEAQLSSMPCFSTPQVTLTSVPRKALARLLLIFLHVWLLLSIGQRTQNISFKGMSQSFLPAIRTFLKPSFVGGHISPEDPVFVVLRFESLTWRSFLQHSFHVELRNGL